MDKIIVGFSTPKCWNPLSWMIRKAEGTEFSHCYIKFYSATYDMWLVYHASHTMIHFLGEEKFLEKNKIIEEYELDLSVAIKVSLIRNAIHRCGIPYGFLQMIGMMFSRFIYLWFHYKIKNPFADGEKTEVCSDLLYYDLQSCISFGDFIPEYDGPRKIRNAIALVGRKL